MNRISSKCEKFLKEKDVVSAVVGFEQGVNDLSCKVDAFVVKNSVKLLIRRWFSDIIIEEKN
jgi:hypothetical protein